VRVTAPRRGFLKALALAPIVPAVAPQAPAPAGAPPAVPAAAAPTGAAAVAEALAEAARREFPGQLEEKDLAVVRREIESTLGSAAQLRAAAGLRNGDEPVTRFQAWPPVAPPRGGAR
jgi:hypothetical protein